MNICKSRKTIIVALILLIFGFSQAHANSRFTVKNNSSNKLLVNIYNGDDSICLGDAKYHTIGTGSERSMGCAGGGKHRCKALISVKIDGPWHETCQNLETSCTNSVVILKNHSTLVVKDSSLGDGTTTCEIVLAD